MDCCDVERALLAGRPGSDDDLRAHAETCETCRFLISDDGVPVAQALAGATPGAPEIDLDALQAELMQRLAAERGPLGAARSLSRPIRLLAAGAVMALGALFFYWLIRRPDWDAYDPARMWLMLGGCGVAGLALVWMTLRPIYLPPLAEQTLRGVALAGALVPVLLSLLPEVDGPIHVPGFSYLRSGYLCFSIGAGMSLVCLLVARALDRGGHRGGWNAILAALGAGMVGVIAAQIFCPVNAPLHLLTGHATIPSGLALGTVLFRRLTA